MSNNYRIRDMMRPLLANAQLREFKKSNNTENLREGRLEIDRDQAKRVRADLGCANCDSTV